MSALDHAHLLTRLIILAEAVLQARHAHDLSEVIDLHEKIDAEYQRPSDGERVITDVICMCTEAVVNAHHAMMNRQRVRSFAFTRVVGVLLPDVRDALALAIEVRKRPTP